MFYIGTYVCMVLPAGFSWEVGIHGSHNSATHLQINDFRHGMYKLRKQTLAHLGTNTSYYALLFVCIILG